MDPPQDIEFKINLNTNKPSFKPELVKAPKEPPLDTNKILGDIQLSPKKAALLQAVMTGIAEGRDLAANKILGYQDDPGTTDKQIPTQFTMDGKTYAFVKLLAQGGGGTVYTYKDNQSNEEVVLKMSNDAPLNEEAISHHYINSGNVTAMKGALRTDTGEVLIVMEKARGDGQNLMDKLAQTQLSDSDKENVMLSMMSDVFKGMAHVHQQKASHNDVKVGNIYIDEHGTAKVADPGEMRVGDQSANSRFGTALFNSPEVNEDGRTADRQKNDIWSAGAMLYKMYTGNIPFDHPDLKDISRDNATLQSNIDFGKDPNNRMFTQHLITPVQEVINAMMHPDPAQRNSFESLSKMSFFQNIDPQVKAKIGQIMTTLEDHLDQIH